MAKVTFLNAILSGKLGGTIYGHNKAGYYVRQFSMPTNPKTQAQVDLRTSFNTALQAWHSLDNKEKSAWNAYALTNFKGKSPVVGVVYSGFMAFCSLRAIALNAQRVARETIMSDPVVSITPEDFVPPTGYPPAESFGAGIKKSDHTPLALSLYTATLSAETAALTLTFQMEGIQPEGPIFADPIGQVHVGFAAFMSLPMQQQQMFIHKPNLMNIGSIKPFTLGIGWVPGDKFTLSCSAADFAISHYKLWCTAGDFIRITAYTVSKNGQTQPCGACGCYVTA